MGHMCSLSIFSPSPPVNVIGLVTLQPCSKTLREKGCGAKFSFGVK